VLSCTPTTGPRNIQTLLDFTDDRMVAGAAPEGVFWVLPAERVRGFLTVLTVAPRSLASAGVAGGSPSSSL
jgi:hypothetical protein